jgi:hypothetical protein
VTYITGGETYTEMTSTVVTNGFRITCVVSVLASRTLLARVPVKNRGYDHSLTEESKHAKEGYNKKAWELLHAWLVLPCPYMGRLS